RADLRYGEHAAPVRRHRVAQEERGRAVAAVAAAALEDEPAALEGPGADRGAPRTPHRRGQLGRGRRPVVEHGESARDGQGNLGPRAQPGMGRDHAVQPEPGAAAQAVVIQEATRVQPHALRLLAGYYELRRRPR